ncbi:MAG: hypothetical protein EBQ57_08480, partial [Actinobacteria bacterium]|nr:hypothetical protein [Actinomycetota bacterium]
PALRRKAAPDVDVLYGDTRHDVKREDRLPSFQRRPAFSPERLRSHNYIGETLVVRRQLVNEAGGLAALTATDAHDRNLRLCERAKRIERVAEIFNVTPSATFCRLQPRSCDSTSVTRRYRSRR